MKLPISIEHDSLRCETSVLIDLAATLSFASQKSLSRNSLVGEYIRGPKNGVHNVNGQRDLQCFLLATVSPTMFSFSQKTFLGLRFQLSSATSQFR
jgi:hypothetical protein